MIAVIIFISVVVIASLYLQLTKEIGMPICSGYEKDCVWPPCDEKRREWVRQESVHLTQILNDHLKKIEKEGNDKSLR